MQIVDRVGSLTAIVLATVTQAFPAAVLWDLDGTLVGTEPYWMAAETDLVTSFGGAWTHDDALTLVGSGLHNSARALQGRGVALDEDTIVERLTDSVLEQMETAVPWRPGAVELLTDLKKHEVPLALVTMSNGRMVRRIADSIPITRGEPVFSVIVSGDMVREPKPHPEAYLLAAQRLGVAIEDCVAIEDSHTGLASALASGSVTIGVPYQLELSHSVAYHVWPTLVGKTADSIATLFSRRAPVTESP